MIKNIDIETKAGITSGLKRDEGGGRERGRDRAGGGMEEAGKEEGRGPGRLGAVSKACNILGH